MSYQRTVKNFLKSHKGQNVKALALVLQGIDHLHEHEDWTGLAALIAGTEGKMSGNMRRIVGECLGGVSLLKSATHPIGMEFKLGENWGPTEKLGVLRDLVADAESIFSDRVEQGLLGKEVKEPEKKSLDDCRGHVAKYLAKHGFKLSDLTGRPMSEEELADAALEAAAAKLAAEQH